MLCRVSLFLLYAALLVLHASGAFMKGLSGVGSDPRSMQLMKNLTATHARRYIFWNSLEPTLVAIDLNLTVEMLKANPSLIYKWANTSANWAYGDAQVNSLLSIGATPVIEIGEGTHYGIPKFNGTLADPSVIGVESYLAYQYRACRATVNRYKQHVSLWQIENELNEAFLAGIYGQRMFSALWGNWTFLTQLLAVLRDAVKDEDPTANVTMNIHTDVPEFLHQLLHLKGYYLDAVTAWAPLLDVISIDCYPNMYVAYPSLAQQISDRISLIQPLVGQKGVFVMETGYPINEPSDNASYPFNFTTSMQAQYAAEAALATKQAGGVGFFYFMMQPQPGMVPPPGGYTADDASFFEALKALLLTNDMWAFVKWLLDPPLHIKEVWDRAAIFMAAPDNGGWGILDMQLNPRPAYFSLQKVFSQL